METHEEDTSGEAREQCLGAGAGSLDEAQTSDSGVKEAWQLCTRGVLTQVGGRVTE